MDSSRYVDQSIGCGPGIHSRRDAENATVIAVPTILVGSPARVPRDAVVVK